MRDVAALQTVLADPEMGGFDPAHITVLTNPPRQKMEDALYELYANRQKEDLLLLYFSGHGVADGNKNGAFYLTCRNTRKGPGGLVTSTAVAARTVQEWMQDSKSDHIVIILDSCYSGAFAKGVQAKDTGTINLEQHLGGKGRAILTASTSAQYALALEGFELSVYTHYLVEGLRTGGADRDDDGWIGVEELHEYVSGKVREAAPAMTPEFYPVREGHKILLAKSPKDDPRLKYRKEVEKRAHQGRFTVPARKILNSRRQDLGLGAEVAAEIEAEVLQPYQEYQRKLEEYEQTLIEMLEAENPLSQRALQDLKDYQQHLALREEDVGPIEAKLLPALPEPIILVPTPPREPEPALRLTPFEFDWVTLNAKGKEQSHQRGRAEGLTEDLGNGITLDLVAIPGGEFWMGSPDDELDRTTRESPRHLVTVPPFLMGRYAVTQAQWRAVAALPQVERELNPDPSHFKGANRPVEKISWWVAMEFCARLARKTGKPYRLPSEAEWEYACRGGTTTPFHLGPTISPEFVNYDGNSTYGEGSKGPYRKQTVDGGSFPANAWGLYEMHGNVREWCLDHFHGNYHGAPIDGSAWINEGDSTSNRVLRGGSWINYPRNCRSAYRDSNPPDDEHYNLGFRVVCSPAWT